MKLILAQGNPGNEYAKSRHNIGWQILDFLAKTEDVSFTSKPKFLSEITEINHGNQKILLAKPQTFYNNTGKAGRIISDFYKISPADILVIHDDLSLKFGTIRIRQGGSDGGNNGLKSLNSHLSGPYWHIKIGIMNNKQKIMDNADFVLANFSPEEQADISKSIAPKTLALINTFIDNEAKPTSMDAI